MKRLLDTAGGRRGGPLLALLLCLPSGLAAGCGEGTVAVAFATAPVAQLAVDGAITVAVDPFGNQTVSGTIVNTGDVRADQVEVTLDVFVLDAFGRLVPWQTVIGLPVFNRTTGTRTLLPGERGDFAVVFRPPTPPIRQVDVTIGARFAPDGGFFVFIFTPGLVIIGG